ncbi:MAG: hypothetical protein AAGJ08_01825 [Cyanobacteria bacterium P01_H01_bin.35]
MSYHTYRKPLIIPEPTPPIEFSTQTTSEVPLPDGGTLEAPISSAVTEILAASTEYRRVSIENEGPGTVHLYIGNVPPAWESAPKSATKIEPGGYVVSRTESCKAKLSGWSEGGEANLVMDVVM